MKALTLLLYVVASGSIFLAALAWLSNRRGWAMVQIAGAVACVIVAEFV
jgi:hypothetical protein